MAGRLHCRRSFPRTGTRSRGGLPPGGSPALVDVVGGSVRQIGEQHRHATVVEDVARRGGRDRGAVTPAAPATRRINRPLSSASGHHRASGRHRHNHAVRVDPQPTTRNLEGGINCIVQNCDALIRLLSECPIPGSEQLPVGEPRPPRPTWDVCWGSENVQAVQAPGLPAQAKSGAFLAADHESEVCAVRPERLRASHKTVW